MKKLGEDHGQSYTGMQHVEYIRCVSWAISPIDLRPCRPEQDDQAAIKEKSDVIISFVTTVLVYNDIERTSSAPRFRSDLLSACTVA